MGISIPKRNLSTCAFCVILVFPNARPNGVGVAERIAQSPSPSGTMSEARALKRSVPTGGDDGFYKSREDAIRREIAAIEDATDADLNAQLESYQQLYARATARAALERELRTKETEALYQFHLKTAADVLESAKIQAKERCAFLCCTLLAHIDAHAHVQVPLGRSRPTAPSRRAQGRGRDLRARRARL